MKVTVSNVKTTPAAFARLLQGFDEVIGRFDRKGGVVELEGIFLVPGKQDWSVVDAESDVLDTLLDVEPRTDIEDSEENKTI